mmetsp:Transcript_108442/g.188228  ORF Transcript_108442/g.188228 Transcript_108442/m.188228 type:complete len:123 (+) Transcript_108442:454-822(+)
MYNQIQQMIQQRTDNAISVKPMEYPAPKANRLISSFLGMLQYELMFLLFINDKLLPDGLRENKMMTFFGIWFGGSMVSSGLTKTNAFEIYLGNKRVFSALKKERMPNMRDLIDGFKRLGVQL